MRFFVMLFLALSLAGAGAPRRAPSFCLPDSKLNQHDLLDYRGKVLILDFMRTDCPHCATLSPILEEVKKKYGGKVGVLSILMPPDTTATVQAYAAKHAVTGPFVFDCGQVAASYMRPTPEKPAVTLPHVYIINGSGLIEKDYDYRPDTLKIFEGRALFSELDQLLNQK